MAQEGSRGRQQVSLRSGSGQVSRRISRSKRSRVQAPLSNTGYELAPPPMVIDHLHLVLPRWAHGVNAMRTVLETPANSEI